MARGLHLKSAVSALFTIAVVVLVSALLASCVFVREFEVETDDAGFSDAPIIESASTPFEFPGPFVLERDDVDAKILLSIADNDLSDTLHVRLFLDYDATSGAFLVSDCTAPASGERRRQVSCPADRICSPLDSGDMAAHTLEVAVSDREWLTAGEPGAADQDPLREVARDLGANLVIRGWSMSCQ